MHTHIKTSPYRQFPGGLVVRTWGFQCWGPGSITGQGTKIPPATRCGQIKKKKITLHTLDIYNSYLSKHKLIKILLKLTAQRDWFVSKGTLAWLNYISMFDYTFFSQGQTGVILGLFRGHSRILRESFWANPTLRWAVLSAAPTEAVNQEKSHSLQRWTKLGE